MAPPRKGPALNSNFRKIVGSSLRRRVIAAIGGPPGSGKTHFALSAPGPIALMNFDEGYEGLTEKFPDKEVYVNDFTDYKQVVRQNANNPTLIEQRCAQIWDRLMEDYENALDADMRTIVFDTFDETNDLAKYASFGKNAEIMPFLYRFINTKMDAIVNLAKAHDSHVLFLSRMKPVFDNPTEMKWGGWKDLTFAVHLDAEMRWEPPTTRRVNGTRMTVPGGFFLKIGSKCRANAELRGLELDLPPGVLDFATVMAEVFTGTTVEDWEA